MNNYGNADFDVIIIDGINNVKCAEICEKIIENWLDHVL